MVKSALVAALVFTGVNAHARLVEIVCKPNSNATVSQFVASASLFVDDADQVTGKVQFATRSSQSAQTSDIQSAQVSGSLKVIPAGELTNFSIESFQVSDDSGVKMILNPNLDGPNASTLLIDRKYRYSSECKMVAKENSNTRHHD